MSLEVSWHFWNALLTILTCLIDNLRSKIQKLGKLATFYTNLSSSVRPLWRVPASNILINVSFISSLILKKLYAMTPELRGRGGRNINYFRWCMTRVQSLIKENTENTSSYKILRATLYEKNIFVVRFVFIKENAINCFGGTFFTLVWW